MMYDFKYFPLCVDVCKVSPTWFFGYPDLVAREEELKRKGNGVSDSVVKIFKKDVLSVQKEKIENSSKRKYVDLEAKREGEEVPVQSRRVVGHGDRQSWKEVECKEVRSLLNFFSTPEALPEGGQYKNAAEVVGKMFEMAIVVKETRTRNRLTCHLTNKGAVCPYMGTNTPTCRELFLQFRKKYVKTKIRGKPCFEK